MAKRKVPIHSFTPSPAATTLELRGEAGREGRERGNKCRSLSCVHSPPSLLSPAELRPYQTFSLPPPPLTP